MFEKMYMIVMVLNNHFQWKPRDCDLHATAI